MPDPRRSDAIDLGYRMILEDGETIREALGAVYDLGRAHMINDAPAIDAAAHLRSIFGLPPRETPQ